MSYQQYHLVRCDGCGMVRGLKASHDRVAEEPAPCRLCGHTGGGTRITVEKDSNTGELNFHALPAGAPR